jgi:hypothetical protein
MRELANLMACFRVANCNLSFILLLADVFVSLIVNIVGYNDIPRLIMGYNFPPKIARGNIHRAATFMLLGF